MKGGVKEIEKSQREEIKVDTELGKPTDIKDIKVDVVFTDAAEPELQQEAPLSEKKPKK